MASTVLVSRMWCVEVLMVDRKHENSCLNEKRIERIEVNLDSLREGFSEYKKVNSVQDERICDLRADLAEYMEEMKNMRRSVLHLEGTINEMRWVLKIFIGTMLAAIVKDLLIFLGFK